MRRIQVGNAEFLAWQFGYDNINDLGDIGYYSIINISGVPKMRFYDSVRGQITIKISDWIVQIGKNIFTSVSSELMNGGYRYQHYSMIKNMSFSHRINNINATTNDAGTTGIAGGNYSLETVVGFRHSTVDIIYCTIVDFNEVRHQIAEEFSGSLILSLTIEQKKQQAFHSCVDVATFMNSPSDLALWESWVDYYSPI